MIASSAPPATPNATPLRAGAAGAVPRVGSRSELGNPAGGPEPSSSPPPVPSRSSPLRPVPPLDPWGLRPLPLVDGALPRGPGPAPGLLPAGGAGSLERARGPAGDAPQRLARRTLFGRERDGQAGGTWLGGDWRGRGRRGRGDVRWLRGPDGVVVRRERCARIGDLRGVARRASMARW